MRKIGIHDDDKVARNKIQSMNIGTLKTFELRLYVNNAEYSIP